MSRNADVTEEHRTDPAARRKRARRHLWWTLVLLLLIPVLSFLWSQKDFRHSLTVQRFLFQQNLAVTRTYPALPSAWKGERVLVFAPHEDDEVIGCAGYIQQAYAVGAHLRVVLLTNGDATPLPGNSKLATALEPKQSIAMGYQRQRETRTALAHLGVPADSVTFLGYPNGPLESMWRPRNWLPQHPVRSYRTYTKRSPYRNSMTPGAIYCGQSLLSDLETILFQEKPDVVFVTLPYDLNEDHYTAYAAISYALEESAWQGQSFAQHCQLYGYLIHRDRGYWPAPQQYHPDLPLYPPASLQSLPDGEWRSLNLSEAQVAVKHRAIACYSTQNGEHDPLLQAFARKNELFGISTPRTWQIDDPRSPALELVNPSADTEATCLNTSADITHITLQRKDDRLLVRINTCGPANKTAFSFRQLAGGPMPDCRVNVEYAWSGSSAQGWLCRQIGLTAIHHLTASSQGNSTLLSAPWPFTDGKQQFVQVQAWTSTAQGILDSTASVICRFGKTTALRRERLK